MKNCRKCNENLFSDQYDICMTCYELENTPMNNIDPKQLTAIEIKLDHLTTNLFRLQKSVEANNVYESGHLYLTDVIEDKYKYYSGFSYNKDLTALAKLNYLTDIFFDKRDDAECQKLDQQYTDALLENWVVEEENERLKEELGAFYEHYIGAGTKKDLTCIQMLNHLLQTIPADTNRYKEAQDGQEYLRCLHQEGDKHQSVGLWILDCLSYKEALEEIIKRPRRSETCKLIAQKALGLLSDDDYQPELLIEENLELRMKVEDLESKLITETLEEIHPFMHCHYCGELKGYHHEKNCIHQKFLDLQSRFNVCEGLRQQYYNQLCEEGLAEYGN